MRERALRYEERIHGAENRILAKQCLSKKAKGLIKYGNNKHRVDSVWKLNQLDSEKLWEMEVIWERYLQKVIWICKVEYRMQKLKKLDAVQYSFDIYVV